MKKVIPAAVVVLALFLGFFIGEWAQKDADRYPQESQKELVQIDHDSMQSALNAANARADANELLVQKMAKSLAAARSEASLADGQANDAVIRTAACNIKLQRAVAQIQQQAQQGQMSPQAAQIAELIIKALLR